MGPHVPRHNKWVRGDDDIAREIIVGGRVRLIRRFAYRGHSEPRWDERFGVIGDIGDVTGAADTFITVRWPNGTDPHFDSTVDRNCVEATLQEPPIVLHMEPESEWQDLGYIEEDDWDDPFDEEIVIEPAPRITFRWSEQNATPPSVDIMAALRRIEGMGSD